jgi:predicted Zn finger-like uncharacterized protein
MTIIATRCPACSTTFEMKPDQLALADGWVRCGRCSEIFDGVASRRDIPGAGSTIGTDADNADNVDDTDDAPTSIPPPRQADPWSGMPSLDLGLAPAQAPSAPPLPEAMVSDAPIAPSAPTAPTVASPPSPDAPDPPSDERELPPPPPPASADERATPAAPGSVTGAVPGALFRESEVVEPAAAPAKRRGWSKGVRLALVLMAVAILLVLAVRLMYGQRGTRVSMAVQSERVAAASSPVDRPARVTTISFSDGARVIGMPMPMPMSMSMSMSMSLAANA